MRIFAWRCWLTTLWYFVRHPPVLRGPFAGAWIDGHDNYAYVPDGVRPIGATGEFLAYVSFTKCANCGRIDFGWREAGS